MILMNNLYVFNDNEEFAHSWVTWTFELVKP